MHYAVRFSLSFCLSFFFCISLAMHTMHTHRCRLPRQRQPWGTYTRTARAASWPERLEPHVSQQASAHSLASSLFHGTRWSSVATSGAHLLPVSSPLQPHNRIAIACRGFAGLPVEPYILLDLCSLLSVDDFAFLWFSFWLQCCCRRS